MNDIVKESTVVEEYEYKKPENGEIDYTLDEGIEDCENKFFHTADYRCVYDMNFTNTTNNAEKSLTIGHGFLKNKFE